MREKVGRNDVCPCGSGKKFKKCCMQKGKMEPNAHSTSSQGEPDQHDPYLALIDEQWDNIVMVYTMFKAKNPIIEFHIDDQKIYSYPAFDYIHALSDRTREATHKLYQDTLQANKFMLFVKDTPNRRLRSYIFPIPNV